MQDADTIFCSEPRSAKMHGPTVLLIAAAAVLAAGVLAVLTLVSDVAPDGLPPLPDPRTETAPVVRHLRAAHRRARRRPASAEAVGSLGFAFHSEGYYDHAQACYQRAAALDPEDWRWFYWLALLHAERGDTQRTIDMLDRALALNDDYAPGWYLLGQSELKQGRYELAEAAFQKAASREWVWPEMEDWQRATVTPPVAAYANLERARIRLLDGRAAEAAEILEEIVRAHPQFAAALRLLAQACEVLGRSERVQALLHSAVLAGEYFPPLDPMQDVLLKESHSSTILVKGVERALRGRETLRAEYLARRAVQVNPSDVESVRALAMFLVSQRRLEEARPWLERFEKMSTSESNPTGLIGDALVKAGMLHEAVPYFMRSLSLRPDAPDRYKMLNNIGLYWYEMGQVERAVEFYRQALAIEPNFGDALGNLAQALLDIGQTKEAAEVCRRALAVQPESSLHALFGRILLAQGRLDEAIEQFTVSLAARPGAADVHNDLGAVLLQAGRRDEAIECFREAIRLDASLGAARSNLAWALMCSGHAEEAIEQYREVVRLRPDDPAVLNHLARLLATHPDANVRNAHEAIQLAERACARMGGRVAAFLDTLAAACAEAGRFREAIAAALQAIELCTKQGDTAMAEEIRARVRLYETSRPYHAPPPCP